MSQMLLKPGQIDNLPHLNPELKAQYKHGLANLWQIWETNPEGSQARKEAETKIRTASTKLMQQLAQARGGRPGSGGGPPRPGQPQQGGMQHQAQMGQQGNQAQMAQAQAQAQAAQAQAQAQAQARQAGTAGQPGAQPPQRFERVNDRSQVEIDSVVLVQPPNTSDAQWEQAKANWRREAINLVGRRDHILARARQMSNQMQQMRNQGVDIQPTMIKSFEETKKALDGVLNRWKAWKAHGEGQAPLQQQQQQQQSPNGQQPQQRPETQQGVSANVNGPQSQPQSQQQDAKPVNPEQRLSRSPPQPPNGFQAQQQAQTTQAQTQQGTSAQQNMAPQQPSTPGQQQQQASQSAAQSQPNNPNFPQQNPQQQQARPPPINTQVGQNPMGVAQSNPASAAQPNQQRPPQPLNHQQATQAAANYRTQEQGQGQQQQQQPQAQPQLPNGLPFSQQPSSATQQNTPNSVYPNIQTQQNIANTKFPIPKTLNLDPRGQTAVAGPPSRPTLNNQGMMYNPGIQRPPPYTLEGEGDRVLSKRKLDELVRQVTGAAPSSDNSESSSVLAPDVEESVLQVADDFVDSVITGACRLAKLRPNQTLDVRDVQMVLERNYGIRIPGYSLDEVRTVRKFQPAPGWQTKMQAVQAGKVMGSKDS